MSKYVPAKEGVFKLWIDGKSGEIAREPVIAWDVSGECPKAITMSGPYEPSWAEPVVDYDAHVYAYPDHRWPSIDAWKRWLDSKG